MGRKSAGRASPAGRQPGSAAPCSPPQDCYDLSRVRGQRSGSLGGHDEQHQKLRLSHATHRLKNGWRIWSPSREMRDIGEFASVCDCAFVRAGWFRTHLRRVCSRQIDRVPQPFDSLGDVLSLHLIEGTTEVLQGLDEPLHRLVLGALERRRHTLVFTSAAGAAEGSAAAQIYTYLVLQADVHLVVVTLQVVHKALSATTGAVRVEPRSDSKSFNTL